MKRALSAWAALAAAVALAPAAPAGSISVSGLAVDGTVLLDVAEPTATAWTRLGDGALRVAWTAPGAPARTMDVPPEGIRIALAAGTHRLEVESVPRAAWLLVTPDGGAGVAVAARAPNAAGAEPTAGALATAAVAAFLAACSRNVKRRERKGAAETRRATR